MTVYQHPWILVGPSESRRVELMQRACVAQGLGPAPVVDYCQLMCDPGRLAEIAEQQPGATIKIESTGEAADLHHQLIMQGWQASGEPGPCPVTLEHGELAYQHLWYAGYRQLLDAFPTQLNYLNTPKALLQLIDKSACQQRLLRAGVSVPNYFGLIDGYSAMRQRLDDSDCDAAFIKPRYGSSAAGVFAYRRNRSGKEVVLTTTELLRTSGRLRMFNTLRLRRYTEKLDIADLVDAIAKQGAYLESWIPKPRPPEQRASSFDLRITTLDAGPRHRVARIARGPLTNLHLGNHRVAAAKVLNASEIEVLEAGARRAAAVFPGCRSIGLDMIVHRDRYWVLEANGYGDLLLDLSWQGRSTHEDQVHWLAASESQSASSCLH